MTAYRKRREAGQYNAKRVVKEHDGQADEEPKPPAPKRSSAKRKRSTVQRD